MFKDHDDDNKYQPQEGDTVIGASIKIEGDLSSQGNIIVEGQVVGSVKTEKHLTVGQNARVDAEIVAGETVVAGEINGNLTINGRTELKNTARVNGDIKTKVLKVEEGATINGKVEMGEGVAVSMPATNNDKEKKEDKSVKDEEVDF
ncbi:MAG TPA: polymer-forming cytoskeletal protein [Candidatus Bipolaricaulota bacterium]|nr:polymer-forming cytoskeletal protein [Candidatus Bipolaricaulota bacterium]